jgi:hypothetical protein
MSDLANLLLVVSHFPERPSKDRGARLQARLLVVQGSTIAAVRAALWTIRYSYHLLGAKIPYPNETLTKPLVELLRLLLSRDWVTKDGISETWIRRRPVCAHV